MYKDQIDHVQFGWREQRPDLDIEPMGIVLRIQALAKILGDQVTESLREYDLEWWQYDVLSTLRRQGKPFLLSATELAGAVKLTSGAMTNRIDRLEDAGLVKRRADRNDRRKVLVQLTSEGLSVVERAIKSRFITADQALDGLDASERAQLDSLLRNVVMRQSG